MQVWELMTNMMPPTNSLSCGRQSTESNGGYSLGYNVEELRRRIHALAKDNSLTDIADEFNAAPTVEFL